MTPQEKAKELVRKYSYHARIDGTGSSLSAAKQCAIILADEMLSTLTPYMGDNNARVYWNEVKTEIENL